MIVTEEIGRPDYFLYSQTP